MEIVKYSKYREMGILFPCLSLIFSDHSLFQMLKILLFFLKNDEGVKDAEIYLNEES